MTAAGERDHGNNIAVSKNAIQIIWIKRIALKVDMKCRLIIQMYSGLIDDEAY